MKRILGIAVVALVAISAEADSAVTNVVQYTDAQKDERAARATAWRETWMKMSPEEREAHRSSQKRKLLEQRTASGEVARTRDKDGNIVITYRDGSVCVHKCGK